MVDEPQARELANAAFGSTKVVLGEARELNHGWFFPCIDKHDAFGGVTINKQTGRPLRHLSDQLDRAVELYDRGFQFEEYDLVVHTVANPDETVGTIALFRTHTVDVYYKYGRVWRVGRPLTADEIRGQLSTLPAIFYCRLNFHLNELERAREAGWFTFEALEYRRRE
jgi:hypothetical protein